MKIDRAKDLAAFIDRFGIYFLNYAPRKVTRGFKKLDFDIISRQT